jgi:hypothetical protein
MPIVEYPFLAFSPRSPWRPLLPVEIANPHTQQAVQAYAVVDTGATLCAFPVEHADDIGIALRPEDRFPLESAGNAREAYGSMVTIRVFAILQAVRPDVYTPPKPVLELVNTRVAFVHGLKGPVLGVQGFLDRYVVTVSYPRYEFSIRVPAEERACKICRPPRPLLP